MSGPAEGSPSGGWVPDPPTARPESAGEESPVGADDGPQSVDVASETDPLQVRGRALASAVAAYTAAYGHPLQTESMTEPARTHRWATPGRVTATAVVVLVMLGGVVVARAAQQSPSAVVALDETPPDAIAADGSAVQSTTVVLHVVGQVVEPGLVTLPAGARVADAIEAAGGAVAEADLSAVNLARIVTDGEQILVPRPGEAVPEAGGGGSGSGLVNLNAANTGTLETLPGIGPVLAQRIVDWRADHGRFTSVDELTEISGIGPALLDGVRDLVTVG